MSLEFWYGFVAGQSHYQRDEVVLTAGEYYRLSEDLRGAGSGPPLPGHLLLGRPIRVKYPISSWAQPDPTTRVT